MLAQSESLESPAMATANVRPAQTQEQHLVTEDQPVQFEVSAVETDETEVTDQVPITSRATPAKKEVLAAVRRSVDTNGERLLQGGSLDSQPSVSMVDRFKIVAINIQGDSGIVDLEVKQMGALQYGKAVATRSKARRQVMLSRQEQGWVLVMPQDLVCLDRDVAVVALTDHLATTPRTSADYSELKVSRKLLNELSSHRSLWHPRTWFRLSS
jgi:hypothetical protein